MLSAAGLMRDGKDAVHAGEVAQGVGMAELIGDSKDGVGGAVDGGDEGDIVARADASIRAGVAEKGAPLFGAVIVNLGNLSAVLVVEMERVSAFALARAEAQIARMHPITRLNGGGRIADHLPELP